LKMHRLSQSAYSASPAAQPAIASDWPRRSIRSVLLTVFTDTCL
jgi:hypothetical protein